MKNAAWESYRYRLDPSRFETEKKALETLERGFKPR